MPEQEVAKKGTWFAGRQLDEPTSRAVSAMWWTNIEQGYGLSFGAVVALAEVGRNA